MKKILFSLLLVLFIASACTKHHEDNRTFTYFNTHLQTGMSYDDIVRTFGAPNGDKGSGIHIYVYQLSDGTAVWIGFTTFILYALHVDANGQVLHKII